jgi:preprotein translocase subunit SecA
MEHLDTMDHLRDSVRLRGYGQRDPLVEYKREGFTMFQRLLDEIDKQVIYSVLKVGVHSHDPVEGQQPQQHVVLQGSESAGTPAQVSAALDSDPRAQGIGRNDTCYCGSGKKFKKCGLINSPEHQKNLAGGAKQHAVTGG